jgi:hypothetical protein
MRLCATCRERAGEWLRTNARCPRVTRRAAEWCAGHRQVGQWSLTHQAATGRRNGRRLGTRRHCSSRRCLAAGLDEVQLRRAQILVVDGAEGAMIRDFVVRRREPDGGFAWHVPSSFLKEIT